jgi:uncharacterized membrane protein
MNRHALSLSLAAVMACAGMALRAQPVLWLEVEDYAAAAGAVQLLDPTATDYGSMARAEASGERFLRFGPGASVTLKPVGVADAGPRTVWLRAFPMPGRRVTLAVDGTDVGTTPGEADTIALVWHRLGVVELAAGPHKLQLRAAEGNTGLAYFDAAALLANPAASPYGRTPAEIITGAAAERIAEDFSATSLEALSADWTLNPPPGSDALVELVPGEDGGALHVHNGAGEAYSLVSRRPLRVRPGDQVTLRLRVRKRTLCETLSASVGGVGALSPQLYTHFTDYEQTWLVPPGLTSPVLVRIDGRAGGDTYISRIEAFRPEPPLSAFATGRFVPRLDNQREGRLFEIERYVVNPDAFAADPDQDGDRRWTLCQLAQEENEVRFSRGTCLKSDSVERDRALPDDGCPPLHLRVGPLEPGRYQVYLNAPGRALGFSRDGKEWTRLPGNRSPALGLLTLTEPWFEFWLDDRYAEPGNPGPTYADFIRFMPIEDPAYTMATATAPAALLRGSADRRQVALTVANPSASPRRGEPVLSGVPIPRGELASPGQARLTDGAGAVVPCQITSTGSWPDGSVKWLLLDFQTSVPPRNAASFVLEYGNAVAGSVPTAGLTVTREGGGLRVDTGPASFEFAPAAGRPLVANLRGAQAPALTLEGLVVAEDLRAWRLSAARDASVTVEDESPFRVVVRLRGRFAVAGGPGPIEFDHRVHLFAGRAEALLEYGFVPTAAVDTIPLRLIRVHLGGAVTGTAEFALGEGQGANAPIADGPRLLQTGASAYGNRGGFPYVLSTAAGAVLTEGQKAAGVVRVGGAGPRLVCIPHFWEQFPKAMGCNGSGIDVDLWPEAPGGPAFVAHAGSAKSHRLGISLAPEASAARWLQPLFATASPEWACASGAFEGIVPRRAGQYAEYEAIVDAAFAATLAERAGYGMEDWGDVWQEGYVAGAKTWSNQEWDLANSWTIPFVRTGDPRFLDYALEAARHFADVDCVHDHRDPASIGGSWMHAHTSLVGHQLEPPNFAHAGWTEGMLNLYHLTGDRRGLEAAIGIADWIARHAPQRDQLPPGGPPYNLHIQRSAGWPLTTLCLLYRETWKPEYLQTARRIVDYARRCQDPERGAWDAQVGHEVPYRGGCVFAYTLLRGLRLYADLSGEKRAEADYVNAARWILCELWRPGHRYLYEQCPLHEPGGLVPFLLGEMAGYATRLSGDPMFAAIGHDEYGLNTSPAEASRLVAAARRSQWGNGILTQAPRLLYEWEQTGLTVPPAVTLRPEAATVKVPIERPGRVALVLRNGTGEALTGITASCMLRGDWQAKVVACPARLEAGAEAVVELECQAPPPVMHYALQNDLAHVHTLVRYRQGDRDGVTWAAVRLEIAPALALSAGWALALKPGATAEVALDVADGFAAQPSFTCRLTSDLPEVVLSAPQITSTGPGAGRVRFTATAAAVAKPASGTVTVEVRSGPRLARLTLDAEIGRFRALYIENPAGDEWRYPFAALRTYPGIAIEFMAPERLPTQFPQSAGGIAARWETVIIGDTGTGAAAFSPAQLQALADFVLAGGGLLTVGGAKCYTAGGYDTTPVAALLPVEGADGSYLMGAVQVEVLKPELTFFEGYDPVFPPFGAHQLLRARPGAEVVARFADGTPFLALGSAGKGRVLALGAIWNHGSGTAFRQWREYGRFVGRCVRWTAGDLQAQPAGRP